MCTQKPGDPDFEAKGQWVPRAGPVEDEHGLSCPPQAFGAGSKVTREGRSPGAHRPRTPAPIPAAGLGIPPRRQNPPCPPSGAGVRGPALPHPIRWLKIAAQAFGTVMGATCWPDVPGRDRQECAPGPARTRQAGAARVHRTLLSGVSPANCWQRTRAAGLPGLRHAHTPPGPALSAAATPSACARSSGRRAPGSPAASEPQASHAAPSLSSVPPRFG